MNIIRAKVKAPIFFRALVVSAMILLFSSSSKSQTIVATNALAEQIMLGNYNPASYTATTVISNHSAIAQGINNGVSPDSLHRYLYSLSTFYNRNMMSDTVSSTKGIGA